MSTDFPLRPLIALSLVIAVFFALNPQIAADWYVYSFDDGTYSHAFLIPFMSAYLAWTSARDGNWHERWSWWSWIALTITLLIYQWVDFAHQRMLSRALLPLCITLSVLCIAKPNWRTLSIGALFWFVTPLWGPVSSALQAGSVHAVTFMMSFTNIPVYVHGNLVEIPAGTFEIANGCSGLRYVIAALALVMFYSAMYLNKLRSVLALAAVAVVGSMLTNWLRIVALILIGHITDMEAEIIEDHNMFGWYLFIPLMFFVFRFAERLERTDERTQNTDRQTAATADVSLAKLSIVVASLTLASGTMIRLVAGLPVYTLPAELNVDSATPLTFELSPHPKLYAVSSSDQTRSNGLIRGKFIFDGNTDASRAEFFMNRIAPVGWQSVEYNQLSDQIRIKVTDGERFGMIKAVYEVNGLKTVERSAITAQRLRAAFNLDRSSTLHWQFKPCSSDNPCSVFTSP